LLVAVVPHGALSNVITFVGRGNVPLSIALTAVTTLACLVTVPLALRALAAGQLPDRFVLPTGRLLVEIGGYLLLPLVTGMVIRRLVPERADRISRLAVNASLVLVGVITVGALGSGRIRVVEYGLVPPLRIVAFAVLIAVCTAVLSYLLGRREEDTMTLVVDVTIRNIGLGLLLVRFFFPGQPEQGHALYTCLFFAGLAPWLALPVALMHRAGWRLLRLRRRGAEAGKLV
jgi:BASS family bile acid:Na+ symporter